jgi:hypothetical protein
VSDGTLAQSHVEVIYKRHEGVLFGLELVLYGGWLLEISAYPTPTHPPRPEPWSVTDRWSNTARAESSPRLYNTGNSLYLVSAGCRDIKPITCPVQAARFGIGRADQLMV